MRLIDADMLVNDDRVCNGIACKECPFHYDDGCKRCDFIQNYPAVPAISISVIEQIKAEIEERKLKSGGEPSRDLAFNVCLGIIDRHIKEYTK